MTEEALIAFRLALPAKREQFKREIKAILDSKDWVLLRSYFHHTASPEDRAVKAILWGTVFLAHYFTDTNPPFHYELAYRFFTLDNEYDAAPRGFSKTTVEQCCISLSVAHGWETFIVVIEKTFTEAAELLSAVRDEFADNPMIKAVYGLMIGKMPDGTEPDKSKDAEGDIFINGVRLRAKGFDTSVRGLKSKQYRPSLILLDDVEQDDHIRNEDQRRKYRENYTQGVVPAVDIDGRVKVRGTILHKDSLLMNLIQQHDGHIYSAFDPMLNIETDRDKIEETLLWPGRWTYDALKRKYDEMTMDGLGSSKFAQEYLNTPLDDASRKFQWEWLQKTFTQEDLKFKTFNRYVCFDVADSKKQGSDWTFKTTVDWDSENNWFIQKAKRRKVNSPELIDWIFETWINDKPAVIGVEKKAFHDQVEPWLKIKSEELDVYPIVVELVTDQRSKEDRVVGALQGRFQAGRIYFLANATDDTNILRGELYDFPKGKNDDGADSLAHISQIGARPYSKQKEQKSDLQNEMDEYFKSKRKPLARRV